MTKRLTLCLGFLIWLPVCLVAAPGDSTWVRAHSQVDLVWNEAYDVYADFPDSEEPYGRVLLYFTMGCASSGCSDWDYTVLLSLVDTVDGTEYDLGRSITPYGGYMRTSQKGFNNDWTRTFVYDISDLDALLRHRQKIRVYYDGWSSGFSATLDFAFIEGIPARPVLGVEVLYYSGAADWVYSNSADFEASYLPERTAAIPPGSKHHRLRITPSGHGFDNNLFCAEFCERDYRVVVNGLERFRQAMWREDCGYNPVYPQAGTWLYDRANWCPGAEAWTHFHEFEAMEGLTAMTLDIDLDSYSWSGPQAPAYLFSALLIHYGEFQLQHDAEVAEILRPSADYAHARFNPSCTTPLIRLANNGAAALQSCTIAYGLEGGNTCYQAWSGNLAYGESELLELGPIDWTHIASGAGSGVFFARVEGPNGALDEQSWNDERRSAFEAVPVYDNQFIVWLRTNARPEQNAWTISNELGEVVASRLSYSSPFTIHQDTVDLPNGCYRFSLMDAAKDGLEFFANSDGTGSIRFARTSSGFMASFDANFGTRLDHEFQTGLEQGQWSSPASCELTGLPPSPMDDQQEALWFALYPNPASRFCTIELNLAVAEPLSVLLRSMSGKLLWQADYGVLNHLRADIPLDQLPAGLYVVEARSAGFRKASLLAVE